MVVKWAEEFKKIHPNVRIDISGGGAGKGMTDALAKVVDLGMVSRDIHDVEIKKGAFAFAVIKDAVVPTINANNPVMEDIKKKGLSREVALKLWNGEYETWGQVLGTDSKVPVHFIHVRMLAGLQKHGLLGLITSRRFARYGCIR